MRSRTFSEPRRRHLDSTEWRFTFPPARGILGRIGSEARTRSDCASLSTVLRSPGHYMRAHRFFSPFPIMTAQLNAYYSLCAMETYLGELNERSTRDDVTVAELAQHVRYTNISMRHYIDHAEHQLLVGLSCPTVPQYIVNAIRAPYLSPSHPALNACYQFFNAYNDMIAPSEEYPDDESGGDSTLYFTPLSSDPSTGESIIRGYADNGSRSSRSSSDQASHAQIHLEPEATDAWPYEAPSEESALVFGVHVGDTVPSHIPLPRLVPRGTVGARFNEEYEPTWWIIGMPNHEFPTVRCFTCREYGHPQRYCLFHQCAICH